MAKKPPAKKPDKDHEKAKELGISHRKGHVVHAGIAVKGGAGYKGRVIKITDDHTWIKIGEGKFGDRIVKAPHRLVTKEEFEDNEMTKLTEGKGSDYKIYHQHYSGAVQHALDHHEKTSGLKVDPDEVFRHIATGPGKPGPGLTVSHNIPATKEGKNGTEHHMIHMQVYNRDNQARDVPEPYELNTYSGKMPRQKKMHEETEQMAALNPTKSNHDHDHESSTHTSANGRHVVQVAKNQYTGKYHGVLHSDNVYQPHHTFMTDGKDEAHSKAKSLVAHAQKHEKPLKEDTLDEAEGFMRHIKVGEKVRLTNPKAPARHTVDKIKGQKVDITKDSGQKVTMPLKRIKSVKYRASQYNKEEVELREDALVSKIINKYIT